MLCFVFERGSTALPGVNRMKRESSPEIFIQTGNEAVRYNDTPVTVQVACAILSW
jgi:hypothetical protein